MNFNIYDNVDDIINKQGTWINVRNKTLLSREIKYRKYTTLVKRYDNSSNNNSYYIIISDDTIPNKKYCYTKLDNYGRVKVKLNSIWNNTICKNLMQDTNINIDLVEFDDTCEVYNIDI